LRAPRETGRSAAPDGTPVALLARTTRRPMMMRPILISAILASSAGAAPVPQAVKVSVSRDGDRLTVLSRSAPFAKSFAPEPPLQPKQGAANSWIELRDRGGQVKLRRSIYVLPEGRFDLDTPYGDDAPILAVLTRASATAPARELARIDLSPPLRVF